MCKHEVEHLIGTKDGIKCRLCGKTFKTFEELKADRKEVPEDKEIITEEQPEEVSEEKPKKAATKKLASKKGAKK